MSKSWEKFAILVLRPALNSEESDFVRSMFREKLPVWVIRRTGASLAVAEEIVAGTLERYVGFAFERPEAQTGAILRRNFDWVIADHMNQELRHTRDRCDDFSTNDDDVDDRLSNLADQYFTDRFTDDQLRLARLRVLSAVSRARKALEACAPQDVLVYFQLFIDELAHDPTRTNNQLFKAAKAELKDRGLQDRAVRNLVDRFKRNEVVKVFLQDLHQILPGRGATR